MVPPACAGPRRPARRKQLCCRTPGPVLGPAGQDGVGNAGSVLLCAGRWAFQDLVLLVLLPTRSRKPLVPSRLRGLCRRSRPVLANLAGLSVSAVGTGAPPCWGAPPAGQLARTWGRSASSVSPPESLQFPAVKTGSLLDVHFPRML